MKRSIFPGCPFPLGATYDGDRVNFAIYSKRANRIELCLFDAHDSTKEEERIDLKEVEGYVWHCCLPGIRPGQLYNYRIHGPYEPESGLRFNPNKLLIDPYSRALSGQVNWNAPVLGYIKGDPRGDLSFDEQDDAWGIPKSVVIDNAFDWEGDKLLQISWNESVIYETHVKGFTIQNPEVPPQQRGTYAGLSSPAAIEYLKNLGINAVELLPVHAFVDEQRLVEQGLRNYWGYNTIGFFAPDSRYSSSKAVGAEVAEFKSMVKALHQAGIEVILDVVYNHTAEGNEYGPTLSFRGIDNIEYYQLPSANKRHYIDYAGTGNSLSLGQPQTAKLCMDSLRYWVREMHVDGFRFDLAVALSRGSEGIGPFSGFMRTIHQDPVLSRVKLIAEPWDIGPDGYQVGNFPPLWTEWNGRYRDTVRKYWRGDPGQMGELGFRLTGSSDLYQDDGRSPCASINFITAHDGFTLNDLVSYQSKHNEANRENNRDGLDDNCSHNYGVEGPANDETVIAIRERQKRNFMATLLLSQGVPMICAGDEIGKTQHGNNNAYCQDNEISWLNWTLNQRDRIMLGFTQKLIHLRQSHPNLRRRKFFKGRPLYGTQVKDITWVSPDGSEMDDAEWSAPWIKTFGIALYGAALDEVDEKGDRISDDSFIILFNSHSETVPFKLPGEKLEIQWQKVFDTSIPEGSQNEALTPAGSMFSLHDRAMVMLKAIFPAEH